MPKAGSVFRVCHSLHLVGQNCLNLVTCSSQTKYCCSTIGQNVALLMYEVSKNTLTS